MKVIYGGGPWPGVNDSHLFWEPMANKMKNQLEDVEQINRSLNTHRLGKAGENIGLINVNNLKKRLDVQTGCGAVEAGKHLVEDGIHFPISNPQFSQIFLTSSAFSMEKS